MGKPTLMLLFLLLLMLFVASCDQKQTIVCTKPYILVGTSCCLDQNDNNICDTDEASIIDKPTKENIPIKIYQIMPKTNVVVPEESSTKNYVRSYCYNGDCVSTEYEQYFKENLAIFDMIIEVQGDLRYVVDDLNELESTGRVSVEKPSFESGKNSFDCLVLSVDEKKEINAAKIAHAIWLDKNNKVPWKLKDYNKEELKTILSEASLGQCPFESGVVDYSPSEAYSYAKQFVKDNELDTSYAIIDDLRKDFRHAFGDNGVTDESKPVFNTLYADLTTYNGDYMGRRRISRNGCHSMADITIALLKSVNIPAYKEKGWYDGDPHASAFFPSIQKVLIHGDDIYKTTLLDATPTEKLLMPYDYFNREVKPCGTFTACTKKPTREYEFNNIIEYPGIAFADCAKKSDCSACIGDFLQQEADVLTSDEIQRGKDKVVAEVC